MMRRSEIAASDLRKMLRLAYGLQDRRPMNASLTMLLAEICDMTDAASAIAYEIRFLARLRRSAQPLLEVVRPDPRHKPQRSPLVGAASLSHLTLRALERAGEADASFGDPAWSHDGLRRNDRSAMHAVQFVSGTFAVGVVVLKATRRATFDERDLAILDTTWRSHRFGLRRAVRSVAAG
jgi:hypothetical protein